MVFTLHADAYRKASGRLLVYVARWTLWPSESPSRQRPTMTAVMRGNKQPMQDSHREHVAGLSGRPPAKSIAKHSLDDSPDARAA